MLPWYLENICELERIDMKEGVFLFSYKLHNWWILKLILQFKPELMTNVSVIVLAPIHFFLICFIIY